MEIAIIVLVIVLIVVLLWHILESRRAGREQADTLGTQLREDLTKTVGDRLDSATRVFGDVQRGLGELSAATNKVIEVGRDISSLQEILGPPKLRGGFGELLLENLLQNILPPTSYDTQYRFSDGTKVDAVIKLPRGLVPVDSKFPLEDFQRLREAQSDEEQRALRRDFTRSVKRHIDSVSKYILPDEGTFDFALMYIPAENVYYETIIRDESLGEEKSIYSYSLQKKVFPVSPNSFYAYLQAIVLGLKGLRVEQSAREIVNRLDRLQSDFQRFQRDFQILGGHLSDAKRKYDDADKKLEGFSDKLLSASQIPFAELEGDENTENPGSN